ncbi:MAG TPA: ATP-binding protein [Acidimicrobiales bacterium]|nr:ATP-binding protein [Acidimicrobiales bacterium]
MRLSLLYGALFLVSAAVLLAITYALVDHNNFFVVRATTTRELGRKPVFFHASHVPQLPGLPANIAQLPGGAQVEELAHKALEQHSSDLHTLLIGSVIALCVMAGLSVLLGWAVAGRALRPLRAMTATAQRMSAHNLHERLTLDGPQDELMDLAKTINGLLGRLDAAFAAQRRFVANASHELRTPLTLERTLLEVALADPEADLASLRFACERAIAAGERHEGLIESLLTLATSERGLDRHQAIDLSLVAAQQLSLRDREIAAKCLTFESQLSSAPTSGDLRLLERLVANLVENAVCHNDAGGWASIATAVRSERVVLSVSNSGRVVPGEEIERLFLPFQRLDDAGEGFGLGLSIVKAIAAAHDARLTCCPRTGGGMDIEVTFPLSPVASPRPPKSDCGGPGRPIVEQRLSTISSVTVRSLPAN